jgi:DNA-binding transcriptional MerR regulator
MIYTVKQLSDMSGISVRTLHFYHEIGLLVPAQIGSNGYRYYEEEQFLLLQQIMFFRELGFKLKKIQTIISNDEFDKITALLSHKATITSNIIRAQKLITTIDKTIAHLNGEIKMDSKTIYFGFDKAKQAEYDQYLIKTHGEIAKSFIAHSRERTKDWSKNDFIRVKQLHDNLYQEFVKAIESNLEYDSPKVQKLVQKHYELVKIFYTPTKEVYARLGQTYCEHPDFRNYFDGLNLKLAEYLARGIRYFAEHKLT